MAVTSKAEGTQTATLTTEHTLLSTANAGSYQLQVDVSNLANGERVRLRIKKKVKSGGTTCIVYDKEFLHAQGDLVVESIPTACPNGADFTLEQNGGTGRAFDWNVVRLDA